MTPAWRPLSLSGVDTILVPRKSVGLAVAVTSLSLKRFVDGSQNIFGWAVAVVDQCRQVARSDPRAVRTGQSGVDIDPADDPVAGVNPVLLEPDQIL